MKPLFSNILLSCVMVVSLSSAHPSSYSKPELGPLVTFLTEMHAPPSSWPNMIFVQQQNLPKPYDFLLTQPVMTQGIAEFYQRRPQVRTPLYAFEDKQQMTYSRGIIMIVDNNKERNNALLADQLHQSTIAELGLIEMNMRALPENFLKDLNTTHHPFGYLLGQYQIKTHDSQRFFLKIDCNPTLQQYLHCTLGSMLYGRTNTLVNEQGTWVARVVEILTGYSLN